VARRGAYILVVVAVSMTGVDDEFMMGNGSGAVAGASGGIDISRIDGVELDA
jgi:hypothetical protein